MKPCVKLYLNSNRDEAVFGSGKWKLLAAIQEFGSISKAADSLGRSYRKAWGDIKIAESGFGRKLVITTRGGRGGGEARLSEFGVEFLKAWGKYYLAIDCCMQQAYTDYLFKIVEPIDEKVSQE